MKIERFSDINENLTTDVKKFIEDFTGNTDNGIVDWIAAVVPDTKLNAQYKGSFNSIKKALEFARLNNFKKLEEYLLIDKEIANKEKEVEKLNKKKEILNLESGNEVMYKFQEDLLNINDFNSFYKLFIEDSVENSPTNEIEDILNFSEIHPKILKKYKDKIKIGIEANKYNL